VLIFTMKLQITRNQFAELIKDWGNEWNKKQRQKKKNTKK